MSRMIWSSLISASRASSVETVAPSRSTVTRSATRRISFSLWLIRIEVIPCALNSIRRSRSFWLSVSCRLAVGSSRMRSFTFFDSALAISTSCCLPTPMSVTSVVGRSRSPTFRSNSSVWAKVSSQSMTPRRAISLPRKMFSAMDRSGTSASSWWMMTMPSRSLSARSRKWRTSPSNRISPS